MRWQLLAAVATFSAVNAIAACRGPAALSRPDNALDEIRQGNFASATGFRFSITVLDWKVDRGKHADSIIAAARAAVAASCVS